MSLKKEIEYNTEHKEAFDDIILSLIEATNSYVESQQIIEESIAVLVVSYKIGSTETAFNKSTC